MRRLCVLLLTIALATVGAACGGGGDEVLYDVDVTRECLREQRNVRVTDDVDFVASSAMGGAVHVRFRDNEVTLAFGEDVADAEQTERAYRRFAPRTLKIQHVLHRQRNVVLLWGVTPSSEASALVTGCLVESARD